MGRGFIVMLLVILLVALCLINLGTIESLFGGGITGFGVYDNVKSTGDSASNGLTEGFVDTGEPESFSSSSNGDSGTGQNYLSNQTSLVVINNSGNSTDEPIITPNESVISDECLDKYNLDRKTIIFYYSKEAHSNAMKLIVQSLQSSFTFYWTNNLWDDEFNGCFGTTGVTPTFVCAGTGEKLLGEVPKSMLESLAGRCA